MKNFFHIPATAVLNKTNLRLCGVISFECVKMCTTHVVKTSFLSRTRRFCCIWPGGNAIVVLRVLSAKTEIELGQPLSPTGRSQGLEKAELSTAFDVKIIISFFTKNWYDWISLTSNFTMHICRSLGKNDIPFLESVATLTIFNVDKSQFKSDQNLIAITSNLFSL